MNPDSDCLACEGKNPVNWLLTRLNPAATTRVCQHDIPIALVALLATELEVEAGWLQEVINTAIEGLADEIEQAVQAADDDDEVRTGYPVHDSDAEPVFEDD